MQVLPEILVVQSSTVPLSAHRLHRRRHRIAGSVALLLDPAYILLWMGIRGAPGHPAALGENEGSSRPGAMGYAQGVE